MSDEENEARAAIEELAAIGAPQLVVGTISTLVNLAFVRLGLIEGAREHADANEAAVAIDAVSALLPVVERFAPPEATAELRATVASLQVAFARAVGAPAPGAAAPAPPPPPAPAAPERPKIWTPRGTV
jgi:hypothetical protein